MAVVPGQATAAKEGWCHEGLEDILGSLTDLVLHLAALPDHSDPGLLALLEPSLTVLQVGENYLLEDCYAVSPALVKRRTEL